MSDKTLLQADLNGNTIKNFTKGRNWKYYENETSVKTDIYMYTTPSIINALSPCKWKLQIKKYM